MKNCDFEFRGKSRSVVLLPPDAHRPYITSFQVPTMTFVPSFCIIVSLYHCIVVALDLCCVSQTLHHLLPGPDHCFVLSSFFQKNRCWKIFVAGERLHRLHKCSLCRWPHAGLHNITKYDCKHITQSNAESKYPQHH